MESHTKDTLVFIPFYDNVPHRMRLRLYENMPSHELLGQIHRHLDSESSHEVKLPFDPSHYIILLFDPRSNSFIPFESSTREQQECSTRILLHRYCVAAEYLSSDVSQPEEVVKEIKEVHPETKSEKERKVVESVSPVPEVEHSEPVTSFERKRFERSNEVMLSIVGLIVAELALQTSSDCELTDRTWPVMLAWALDKANTTLDQLDPTIIGRFKETILSSLACGQKARNAC